MIGVMAAVVFFSIMAGLCGLVWAIILLFRDLDKRD